MTKSNASKTFYLSVLYLLFLAIAALTANWITPFPEDAGSAMHFAEKLQAPSMVHPFGTDSLGRDLFTLIIFGARLSLLAAIGVVGIALFIGVPLGLLAGFKGRWIDDFVMRICDVFLAFPPLLLPVILAAALGPSLKNAVVAVAISWFPWYTRILRAQVLTVKKMPFVVAARATGASSAYLMIKHILPNSLGAVLVQATLDMGYAILAVAGLSFIGFGARPPAIEWGLLITLSRSTFLDYWWTAFFPGLALFATVFAFNLGGEGLRKILAGGAEQ